MESEENDGDTFLLDDSDVWYEEVCVDPDAKTLKFYDHSPDYAVCSYSTLEYEFRDEQLFGRLSEERKVFFPPHQEEWNVRDGVVLERDIRRREVPLGGSAEERIADYKSQLAWHSLTQTDYRFFVMSKHPDLFPPRELRRMIRAQLERLRTVTDMIVAEGRKFGIQVKDDDRGVRLEFPETYPEDKKKEVLEYFFSDLLKALGTSTEELSVSKNLLLKLLGES